MSDGNFASADPNAESDTGNFAVRVSDMLGRQQKVFNIADIPHHTVFEFYEGDDVSATNRRLLIATCTTQSQVDQGLPVPTTFDCFAVTNYDTGALLEFYDGTEIFGWKQAPADLSQDNQRRQPIPKDNHAPGDDWAHITNIP